MKRNPSISSVWSIWDPDALDGLDQQFQGDLARGSTATGRFQPRLLRRNGAIQLVAVKDQESINKRLQLADELKRSGGTMVREPQSETINGEELMIISAAVAITNSEGFLGIVGIDFRSSDLQASLEEIKFFESGFGRIVSHDGIVVAHPFHDRIGKIAPEWKKPDSESGKRVSRIYKAVMPRVLKPSP